MGKRFLGDPAWTATSHASPRHLSQRELTMEFQISWIMYGACGRNRRASCA
jgi:hypothetical protein